MKRLIIGLLAVHLSVGCYDNLYHDLDERSANEMVVALQQTGIAAEKTRDDSDPQRWVVRVPGGSQTRAMHALETRGLPRPEIHGFDAFYPSEGLVPTSSEERVLLQYATAQELRRSIIAIDGVVDAHVNLVLSDQSRLRTQPTRPARASVVVRYSGDAKPPIASAEVQRLVAGGVDGLEPKAVEVLLSASRDTGAPLSDPELVQVGPLAVPAAKATLAQVVFASMVMTILGLAAALVLILVRRRRQ